MANAYFVSSILRHVKQNDGMWYELLWESGEQSWVRQDQIDDGPLIDQYNQANNIILEVKSVICHVCNAVFNNSHAYIIHYNNSHQPPSISPAQFRKIKSSLPLFRTQIVFEIKKSLANQRKLKGSIELPCEEEMFLALFYTIDKSQFLYKYHPNSRMHVVQFEASESRDQDEVINIMSLVLGQSTDDWIRRYYFPWRGLSAGAIYIDISPDIEGSNRNRDRVVFKSVLKKIKEPNDSYSFIIHQSRYLRICYPVNIC